MVDGRSGEALAAKNPREPQPVASATKLMTYYVAARRLRPGQQVVAGPYEALAAESLAGLDPGDRLTARDLFFGLLVASGNDAAATLALRVAASEPDFVRRMNAAARRLGLEETEYVDPIGLSSQNRSSARDLVDLALVLRRDELFRRIVDTPRVTIRSGEERIELVNRNRLVRERPFVSGVKTGTTLEAGYVLVASARRRGVELVSALTGAPSEDARDAATLELLDYGFSLYERRQVVERGERLATVPLAGGGTLRLVAARAVAAVARRDQEVEIVFDASREVEAPVARREPLGQAVVELDGRRVGRVQALASRAVEPPRAEPVAGLGLPVWGIAVLAGAAALALLLLARTVAGARRSPR